MLVNADQIARGIANYFDAELAPQIEGLKKWLARAAVATSASKVPELMEQYKSVLDAAGVSAENGMVDADKVRDLFLEQARATGAVRQVFPVVGAINFTERDIDTLYRHITEMR